MPIKETTYTCEKCRQKYQKEKDAVNCEKNHYEVIEVTKVNYDSYEDRKQQYPISINVKLGDEQGNQKIVVYTRKG